MVKKIKIQIRFMEMIIATFLYVIIFLLFEIWAATSLDGWCYLISAIFNFFWLLIIVPKLVFYVLNKQKKYKFVLREE